MDPLKAWESGSTSESNRLNAAFSELQTNINTLQTNLNNLTASVSNVMNVAVASGDYLLGAWVGGVTSVALTSGTLTLLPMWVPKQTYDGLSHSVGTAQVGGTSTCWLAVYPDDGTGARPNLAAGPLTSAVVSTTTAGQQVTTLAPTWTPTAAGWYWGASLWVASVAPTTAPATQVVSVVGHSLASSSAGTVVRGYSVAGLTGLPSTTQTLSRVSTNLAVSVGLRAA